MTHVITSACVGTKDTSCADVCPVDCIHPRPGEDGFDEAEQLFINPNECIDCQLCVAICPVQAIYADPDVPAGEQHKIAENKAYYE